jgi:hypothetical protein
MHHCRVAAFSVVSPRNLPEIKKFKEISLKAALVRV